MLNQSEDMFDPFVQAVVDQPLVSLILFLVVAFLILILILWPIWKIFQIRKEKRLGDQPRKRTVKEGKNK